MIEIRSYRRVFDLERRIYSVDRLRLNPAGIPVRGIVYFLVLVWVAIACGSLPLTGSVAGIFPWYLRDIGLPGGAATLLTMIRVDGRAFHLAIRALLGLLAEPRRLTRLTARSRVGERWLPPTILALPDGSESRPRRLRYDGPGAVLVRVEHRRSGPRETHGVGVGRGRVTLRLQVTTARGRRTGGKVISLRRGVRLMVLPIPARRER